ncbi:MAG: site-specific DNA-methyltransferase [Dehalococcoidia bacterium]
MSPPRKKAHAGPTPVEAIEHRDERVNIPTGELRDFVAEEEGTPPKVLYPRDPSLDPQLVWKGKDAQDAEDLAVPSVPIYIQETVHPRAIIENLRETAATGEDEPELLLFNDLYESDFDRRVDFYQHPEKWKNRLILGDSLLVMTSLAEKERLKGKVQMIYMDPPYGIKFGSNWQVSTRKRDVKDGKVEDATRQPEQIKAFRDTWELGIHSYLTYLRDRMTVARELLTETGSVFVQIGDENVHLVRSLMDEVFGSENFVSAIGFRTMNPLEAGKLESVYDHLLWYAKNIPSVKYRNLWRDKALTDSEYVFTDDAGGSFRRLTTDETERIHDVVKERRIFKRSDLISSGYTPSCIFPIAFEGAEFNPRSGKSWRTNADGVKRLKAAGRLFALGQKLYFKLYYQDFGRQSLENVWTDTAAGVSEQKQYVVQTNPKVIQRCLLMTTDPGDLVLDPTAGSGTTAVVAEGWGRRWIAIDTSRVAIALARTRFMASRFPFYRLADKDGGDVRRGFDYRTVPRVTLKSIAQNPDIRDGMSHQEIDAAIARHAEQEVLFDQPFEDKSRIRVTGPFTVESISPHRVASDEEDRPKAADVTPTGESFASMILDNLRKAGVQNTVRQEHLSFDALDPFAGAWLHARGAFTDRDGAERTVGVSLGPEYGTVDGVQVKEAAKEALRGAGVDLLLVCGFAFDPDAGERAKEFRPEEGSGWAVTAEERNVGRLPVMLVKMNPDLAMGDDLLKKTGAGNLFMVFGEPDVEIARTDDARIEVEIRGVDVYDPTTGALRSSSVDDIACWMIDTDYDGESFFVRHAYFLGGGEPYANLKRALRAEIDEEAWASLYRPRSRPFDVPSKGRIAVKVINHFGDEVLKVYPIT